MILTFDKTNPINIRSLHTHLGDVKMEEFMEITYLDGFSNEFKIIDPVSKSIKVLIIPKKYIKRIKNIKDFNTENAIYNLGILFL